MKFAANNFYHVFNRGNNKQKIFLQDRNYQFFLSKIKNYICPHVDILAYCLMPNHYHLLVYLSDDAKMLPSKRMQVLERKLGTLQSSYTRAINKQETKTGSLFQAKCKVLQINREHAFTCFHYIHQNPVKAGLCKDMSDWKYSSFIEYLAEGAKDNFSESPVDRNEILIPICSKLRSYNLLGIPETKESLLNLKSSDPFESSDHLK